MKSDFVKVVTTKYTNTPTE